MHCPKCYLTESFNRVVSHFKNAEEIILNDRLANHDGTISLDKITSGFPCCDKQTKITIITNNEYENIEFTIKRDQIRVQREGADQAHVCIYYGPYGPYYHRKILEFSIKLKEVEQTLDEFIKDSHAMMEINFKNDILYVYEHDADSYMVINRG